MYEKFPSENHIAGCDLPMPPTNRNRSAQGEYSCSILCNTPTVLPLPSPVLSITAKSAQKKTKIPLKRSNEVRWKSFCPFSMCRRFWICVVRAQPTQVLNTKNRNTVGHVIFARDY